ncbi:MAG: DUF2905 domain-containing protein [Gammaproteobacteria bacterium]|nr:DUF2905 domain-containing protein [Gammaproteobacteria bacterium]
MGKWLIYAGIVLLLIGAITLYAPWAVNWFGRLPGDIRVETDSGRVFLPITSMIVVSLVLTVVVNLLRR